MELTDWYLAHGLNGCNLSFLLITLLVAMVTPWVLPGLLLVRLVQGEKSPHDLALALVVGLAGAAVFGTAARWLGAPATWPVLAICLACAPGVWRQGPSLVARTDLFIVGGLTLVFGIPLLGEIVPPGGDMSMHTLFVRWIDESVLFPQTLAPFLPDARFDAYTIGFHFASVLTLWKIPASLLRVIVMIGLSFVLFGWSIFYLFRRQGRETATAIAAMLVVMASRNPQSYVGWGGAPTVLSAALALVGVRLILNAWHSSTWRGAALGAMVLAGGALCHPTAGLVMAPLLAVGMIVMIVQRGIPSLALGKLLVALVVGVACVLPFLLFMQTEFSQAERHFIMEEMRQPPQSPLPGLGKALAFLPYTVGDAVLILAGVALVGCMIRRQWKVLMGIVALTLVWIIAYLGTWSAFPLAPFIFPGRVAMYAVPCLGWILVCGFEIMGLEGRNWRSRRVSDLAVHGAVLALLLSSLTYVQQWYHRGIEAGREVVPADLECMIWIRENTPDDVLIATRRGGPGRWIPSLTDRWTTRWHLNNAWHDERDNAIAGRIPDLVYIDRRHPSEAKYGVRLDGDVVFSNSAGDRLREIRRVPGD